MTQDHKTQPRQKRRYDTTRRAQQAAETRRRIVEAAARCFAELGYARTTMGRVADEAGVSVESVNLNGPKRGLLIAAFSQTLVGEETEEGLEASSYAELLAITDRDEFVQRAADLVIAGQRVGIGIWRALSAAAVEEPEVAEAYAALTQRRARDVLAAAGVLLERGWLAEDRPLDAVADTLALLTGFDPYQLYVLDLGHSEDRLRTWLVDMLERTVLRPR